MRSTRSGSIRTQAAKFCGEGKGCNSGGTLQSSKTAAVSPRNDGRYVREGQGAGGGARGTIHSSIEILPSCSQEYKRHSNCEFLQERYSPLPGSWSTPYSSPMRRCCWWIWASNFGRNTQIPYYSGSCNFGI